MRGEVRKSFILHDIIYSRFSIQSRSSVRLFSQMKRLRPLTRQMLFVDVNKAYKGTRLTGLLDVYNNKCRAINWGWGDSNPVTSPVFHW